MFWLYPRRNSRRNKRGRSAGRVDTSPDREKADEPPGEPAAQPYLSPHLTPYLGLRSRLSQVGINRWTVLLLLVLLRMILVMDHLNDDVEDAKAKALSACIKVEDIGSTVASMPHYLSAGVNSLVVDGMQDAVHGMVEVLDLILQAVPAMIIFYINFLTGTYTCLIAAMVHGSLDVVASVTKDATKAFGDVVDDAVKEIQDTSDSLESAINKVTKGITGSFLGKSLPDLPTVDFSEPIKTLKGFDLNADGFAEDVRKLNKDLPTFDEVQNMTSEAVEFPFKLVRHALNDSYGAWDFQKDVFPLAEKQRLTFCSDNDKLSAFFRKLSHLISNAKVIFIVVFSILAAATIAPMAWLEIYQWKRHQRHVERGASCGVSPLDTAYITSRPLTSGAGLKLGAHFTADRAILVRWCVAYATSPPALFVLSLAVSGLLSCLCQWLLLKAAQRTIPELASQVDAYAGNVVASLEKASQTWADDANAVVKSLNDDINKDVLSYVTNATDTVNNTITTFANAMEKELETVFGGTILLDPIKTVIHCVIGTKIENLQKGLTWAHEHAHVAFPMLGGDTFSKGAKDSISGDANLTTFLSSPISISTDEVSGAVRHVTDQMQSNIVRETLISAGLLLIYSIVVLLGFIRMLAGMLSSSARSIASRGGPRHGSANDRAASSEGQPPSDRSAQVGDSADMRARPFDAKAKHASARLEHGLSYTTSTQGMAM